ncbi:MAG: DUF4340 domain-containing protein [Ruminococcaceae bacterium]|nr:DUF4340 domain-containing protein [Oscillospiraceae bacterium]
MSDLNQNNNLNGVPDENSAPEEAYVDEFAGFDTIFSDPAEHKKKAPKSNKNSVIKIVISCLLVVVLGVTLWYVLTYIKTMEEKNPDSNNNSSTTSYELLSLKEEEVNQVVITNKNGTFTFNATHSIKESSSSSSTETVWAMLGGEEKLISSDKISNIISGVLKLSSTHEISGHTDETYGFATPTYTMNITKTDGSVVTVTVGKEFMGQSAYSTSVSSKESVYLVEKTTLDNLDFGEEDLYKSFSISAVDVASLGEKYVTNGTLTSFESITISGKNYSKALVINMNNNELFSAYLPYVISSPESRMGGEAVTELLTMFSSGISSSGIYSTDVLSSSLKQYGLDNPYMTIVLKVANVTRTIKISAVQPDGNYAVVADDSEVICKVPASNITFVDYKATDFYGNQVYMGSITDLSNMTFVSEGMQHSFDIVYDDSDDAEERFVISCDGKKITASYFQNFYQEYVGLTVADFDTSSTSNEAVFTVTMTYTADGSKKTISFYPSSATKYLYKIDGESMGRVGTSEVSRLIKFIERVAEGKDIQ